MRNRNLTLVLATVALGVNFWAWGLLSPLAPTYQRMLDSGPLAISVLVAVPVVVGSLGRIPVGAWVDRYGGRVVLACASFGCAVPVVWLAFADTYPTLLVGAFVLGIGGATFAAGVPFVSSWFPPERRGLALGIFGVGNAGTAVSGFLTPWISTQWGRPTAFLTVAVALVGIGIAVLALGREVPDRPTTDVPFLRRFLDALRLRATIELSSLYAITFGGFVAFGVYLPIYLKTAYDLEVADAALRAAGFTVLATLSRPVGGSLADRYDGVVLLRFVFGVVALCAIVVSFTPAMPVATIAFLVMAIALGIGNGTIFALVAARVPESVVGSVTGVVGAVGGLGGFLPPIVMGGIYSATRSYSIGLMLLSDLALAALVYCTFVMGKQDRV